MEILVFGVLFALIYLLIKKVVVNKIKDINQSLDVISSGDLNETVDVRTNEEFVYLSDDINSTVNTLKRLIDEAAARIDTELEFASGNDLAKISADIEFLHAVLENLCAFWIFLFQSFNKLWNIKPLQ